MTVHLYGETFNPRIKTPETKFYTFSDYEKDIMAMCLISYRNSMKDILFFKDDEILKNLIRMFVYRDTETL